MKKILFIVGGATLMLSMLLGALFVGPLVALAQYATNTPGTATADMGKASPYCQQYFQNLAKRLNVSIPILKQAKLGAKADALAQFVKDGKLTQTQADQIRQRLNARPLCSDKDYNRGEREVLHATFKKYMPALLTQVAQGLNLSTSTLQSDLQKGQTLSQIAKAQNISESQLHTLVLNATQNTLGQAQKAGDLTSQQVTAFEQYLQNHPDMVEKGLNRSFRK
jgi:transcriptional antiterminator